MTPKKNKSADLESKRGMFFLLGLAFSLIAAIAVIQYQQVKSAPAVAHQTVVEVDDFTMDRTVQKRKTPDIPKKIKKINHELHPKKVEDDFKELVIANLFKDSDDDKDLKDIEILSDLGDVETLPFIMIEKIARPVECEALSDRDAQMACFNEWIQLYIARNTIYPELAKQMRLEDKVYVSFVITETGDVEGVEVAMGQYEILNEEAMRVIQALPEMIPGSQRGRKARMAMTLPVNFQLSD